ncbi:MAG: hypothetical protein ACI3XM_11305 [Eubacteriales bacterium]
MKRKHGLGILFIAAMLAATLSCSDQKPAQTDIQPAESGSAAADGSETETENLMPADSLPDADLGGYVFRMTILGDETRRQQTFADTQTGNIINDAVYGKITAVEERFNVDIVLTEDSLQTDNTDVVRKSVLAGDDTCDIAQGHDISMANNALEGLFLNVYDIPYLDFSKPWWPDATLDSMTVADQMYMMFNNISYNNLASTRVLFFNKTLMRNLNIEYPYQMVYDGTWTLDALLEISAQGYSDLNGNGEKDADDQFGFVNPRFYYCFFEPFLVEPYRKDENGTLYYEADIDKLSTITEKFYTLLFGGSGYLAKATDPDGDDATAKRCFSEERSLFIYTQLDTAVSEFSHSNVIYGVLPMPKLDETQTQYYGGSTDRPLAVPITAESHLDTIGIIIEALNAEGYRQVYPAYYEIAMKTRYADQTDDANMMDLVHDNAIISFTYLYGDYKSVYNIMLENLFNASSPSADVASWCAKYEKAQTKRVEKLMKYFEEHRP